MPYNYVPNPWPPTTPGSPCANPEATPQKVCDTDSQEIQSEGVGRYGAVVETGTTAVTGAFFAIQMIEDSVFSALTSSTWSGDVATSVTFPAGLIIYGSFSAFTLASGKVIAYKAAP